MSRTGAGTGLSDPIAGLTGSVSVAQCPKVFAHGADGNLATNGQWTLVWDGENRLLEMESATGVPPALRRKFAFAFAWRGRRIHKELAAWVATPPPIIRIHGPPVPIAP